MLSSNFLNALFRDKKDPLIEGEDRVSCVILKNSVNRLKITYLLEFKTSSKMQVETVYVSRSFPLKFI